MRIGYFVTHFPYETHQPGYYCAGVESAAFNLATKMAERGHEISVFTTAANRRYAVTTGNGLTIYRHKKSFRIGQANMSVSLLHKPLKHDVDIVHAHAGNAPAPIAALVYSKRKKRPLVVTYHGDAHGGWGSIVRRSSVYLYNSIFIERVLSHARAIISPSQHFIDDSKFLRRHKDKTTAIPNGVNLEDFSIPYSKEECRQKLGLDQNERIVLFVGALSPYKGPDVLLNAMQKLLEHVPNARLILVGEGMLKEKLEQQARGLGIAAQIQFAGFVSDSAQKALYFHASDVFVLPSISSEEIFGIVNLEAMACGVPVVASRVGGVPDVVADGETGLLVPPKDPDMLAKAVFRLLHDKDLRNTLSEKGKDKVQNYSWHRIAEQTERVYAEVLA